MFATLVLVTMAVVTAVGVWAWTGGFALREEPPAVGFFARGDGCHPRLMVTAVGAPVDLSEVRVLPAEEGAGYAILFGGRVAVDEPWVGEPPSDFLSGGSTIDLWAEEGRAFNVADAGSGAVLAQIRAPRAAPDASAPSATLTGPATVTAPVGLLAGTASDGSCGGIAAVTVRLTNVDTGGFVQAIAQTSPEGSESVAWTADFAGAPLVPGAAYAVTLAVRDMAGNGG